MRVFAFANRTPSCVTQITASQCVYSAKRLQVLSLPHKKNSMDFGTAKFAYAYIHSKYNSSLQPQAMHVLELRSDSTNDSLKIHAVLQNY